MDWVMSSVNWSGRFKEINCFKLLPTFLVMTFISICICVHGNRYHTRSRAFYLGFLRSQPLTIYIILPPGSWATLLDLKFFHEETSMGGTLFSIMILNYFRFLNYVETKKPLKPLAVTSPCSLVLFAYIPFTLLM